ncbi:hypothetical protein ACGFZQ_34710 [Streptomyces sp. NPDC048254]|uniref:hypothetical protein n=1 Tax=Streptomyces sp. NPDC048254 TaxID=3365525 RepID=UPI00371F2E02
MTVAPQAPVTSDAREVREEREMREPNEVSRAGSDGDRLTPYQLGNAPSRSGEDQTRHRW